MNTLKIAQKYNFDPNELEKFVKNSDIPYTGGRLTSPDVSDSDVPALVERYQRKLQAEADAAELERKQNEAKLQREREALSERNAVLGSILITSGFNFDGYSIVKYSGYISGDDAIEVPRNEGIFGTKAVNVGDALMASLVQIRRNALQELKEAALDLGCNAVIGVDFDYIMLDPETAHAGGGTLYLPYVFGVTANGNAVVIEKNSAPVGN